MSRQPKHPTPEQRIARVLKWAVQQGMLNVADDLRQALADLERQEKEKRD